MIVIMKPNTAVSEIERISSKLISWGVNPERMVGKYNTIIGLIGETETINCKQILQLSPFIEEVVEIDKPFKKASLEYRNGEFSEVLVSTPNEIVTFGPKHPIVSIAGPCSVENEAMIVETAQKVKAAGAKFLRGGAYKPRTSPYSFQGHGEKGLELLATAREATGLGIITEVMDIGSVETVAEVADILQIGARNMKNFSLLKEVGSQNKPIFLKRGMSATIKDLLMAAEYILAAGNPNVILCERGIRTFDRQYTRNTLDISSVPVLRGLTHLPIAIDPSHGTGLSKYVPTMAKAAVVAGADCLMIEVHPDPSTALSDGPQSLTPAQYKTLMQEVNNLSLAVGRRVEKLSPAKTLTNSKQYAVSVKG